MVYCNGLENRDSQGSRGFESLPFRTATHSNEVRNVEWLQIGMSSFSRRSWAVPNEDLYKGNGRVKHQQFIIQQGPFQCIQVHNYQSKDKHDVDNSNEFEVGGNNHFDIYVFRNVGMFGEGNPFQKISVTELEKRVDDTGLTNENAKHRVIIEFINFILGRINLNDVKSNIDTHDVAVKLMSGVSQSSANIRSNKNPLVRIKI